MPDGAVPEPPPDVPTGAPAGVRLRLARLAGGLSQEQLAAGARVSRQAVAGIEAGRFDPSLRVALALAGAVGRTVEELFAAPAPRPVGPAALLGAPTAPLHGLRADLVDVAGRPVALALAADQALRPGFLPATAAVVGPLVPTDAGHPSVDQPPLPPGLATPALLESGPPGHPAVVVAGCDPALGLLAGPLAELRPPRRLAWWPCNSAAALDLAAAGLVHAAGVHLPEGAPRPAMPPRLAGTGAEVVVLGAWQEGLALPPSGPAGPADLAGVLDRGWRLVNREDGSEARSLLDAALAQAGAHPDDVPGYDTAVRSHLLVASAVAAGLGHAGVTMEPAARTYGLDFVPLAREDFLLVVARPALDSPEVQALLRALATPALRTELGRLPAYDPRRCGEPLGTW